MKLITSIFGKGSNITEEDIIEKIVNQKIREDSTREYKEIKKLGDQQIEKGMIAPLIGFINTLSGNGLLILGIKDENGFPVEIKPVDQNLLKNEEQVRAIIVSRIDTIPRMKEFMRLSVIHIPIKESGNVFLIEIEKTNECCVCYSTISQCAYLRRNDETTRLSLFDTLGLITSRNFPRIFIYIGALPETEKEFKFDVEFRNEGFKPGRYVTTLIKFFYDDSLDITLEGTHIQDVSHLNPDAKKTYNITAAYPPGTVLLYPNLSTVAGRLKIHPKKDFELTIVALTYEDEGRTIQEIKLLNKNGAVSVQELSKQFMPYLVV